MGVRTRGLDIKAGVIRDAADKAARAEAEAVIQRWNDQLALGRDMLWSPTIRAALLAGTPWLDVFCPGCGTSKAIDLRTVDRPACFSRHTGVGPAVLVVFRLGADTEVGWPVCTAASQARGDRIGEPRLLTICEVFHLRIVNRPL